MRNLIISELDLSFVDVLGEDIIECKSFGLDDLLKMTFNLCQNAKKGNFFKSIKIFLSDKIRNNLEKVNEEIKFIINEKLLEEFKIFLRVLNDA